MVLIECKVCQRKVAISDEVCPTCGTKNPGINMGSYRFGIYYTFFTLIVIPVFLVWTFIWRNWTSTFTSYPNLNFVITATSFLAAIIGIYLLPGVIIKRQNLSLVESSWAFWFYIFMGVRLLINIIFALIIGYLIFSWLFKK